MSYRHSLSLCFLVSAAAILADTACSSHFEPKSCAVDADCGNNLVCVSQSGRNVCVAPSDAPLRIGQSAAASGPSQDLGLEMKRGIQLAFDTQNAQGGIRGRQLVLDFRDDEYTPDQAEANARALVDVQVGKDPPHCPTTLTPPATGNPFSQTDLTAGPNSVLALIGNVGTPTMVRSAPVIVETHTLYFGAFTGATAMLRDTKAGPCAKYIFNVRASYAQEARATLEYFIKQGLADDAHLISFDQSDTFGDAGYNGLVAAYTAVKNTPPNIKRFRYTRDDVTSVPTQATAVQAALKTIAQAVPTGQTQTVGIMMTDTYGPGSNFIQLMKEWQYGADTDAPGKATKLKILYSNVSFVGPNSLASRLKDLGTVTPPGGQAVPYTDSVFVSQVVPNYQSDTSDAVLEYKRLLQPTGANPTFTSFEGYIDGRIFIEGLKNNNGAFTSDNLVAAFESLASLDIGLGGFIGFTPTSHQASQSIWGTAIEPDGTFTNKYFWKDGSAIQIFE